MFEMVRGACLRFLIVTALLAAEAVLAMTLLAVVPAPCGAQWFWDDRSQNRRPHGLFDWFEQQAVPPQPERPPPVDYSRAPLPKKADPKVESTVTTPILVLGDAMADWLAYGLELAYVDAPEIGILRQHRTNSGLIRTEVRRDPRGEYPDWPQAARDLIATQKPKFVLMMLGINDRRQFRETGPAAQASRVAKPAPAPVADPATLELDKSAPDRPREIAAVSAPEPPAPAGTRNLEFRSDAWSEAYSRRVDDTIAALKTSGVPVFWVGLPPIRGQKAAMDIPFLNDLYRSRADKAGIIYIDVWDGFVDEEGRYAQFGPDVEGQTRRLRTSDGVYFTQAGARKLAHYVEREVQRWLSTRAAPVAVSIPEEPKVEAGATAARPGPRARPLAGPAVPLVAERGNETDDLLGGNARQPTSDAMAVKVLVRGEAVAAPAGRADDFAWPRRDVAPVGSDPVVASTDLPMTPMVAERSGAITVAGTTSTEAGTAQPAKPPVRRLGPPRPTLAEVQQSQSFYRPDYHRPPVQQPSFSFQSLFGGQSWFSRRW